MAITALAGGESISRVPPPVRSERRLDQPLHPAGRWVFLALLVGGLGYAGASILADTSQVGEQMATGVFLFLGLALLIALGFEFVNGFHDTANAVATVIYTNSMSPPLAVVWSGVWNFAGVMFSGGAVAYSIITLLPVDLILQVGSAAGYAMIFALLLAAGTGRKGARGAAVQPAGRLFRRVAGDPRDARADPQSQALRRAGTRCAAAQGHPRDAGIRLHRGQLRARQQ